MKKFSAGVLKTDFYASTETMYYFLVDVTLFREN